MRMESYQHSYHKMKVDVGICILSKEIDIPIEEFLQFPDIQGFGVTKEDLMEELSHRETIIVILWNPFH